MRINHIGLAVSTFIFLLLVSLGLTSSAQAVSFASAVNYGAGTYAFSVVKGDFNQDGILDLATANYGDNGVSILLGISDGTFPATPSYTYGVGTNPRGITTGDFDGDGDLDLAVANKDSNNVSILLGNGNGTFAAAVNYGAGTFCWAVTTGDFDGDGDLDLAVTNRIFPGTGTVSILLNNGSGSFAAAAGSPYTVGNYPHGIISADFDRDGDLDLAVVNNGPAYCVSVLLGDGSGGFAAASGSPYSVGNLPHSIFSGDFNGDGILDLATANFGSNDVSILLGNGDGTFPATPSGTYGAGTGATSVFGEDFDGDGKLDLAVANWIDGNVSILPGNGNGTFGSAVNFTVGTSPACILSGDFNRDGKSDLTTANEGSSNVSILLNTTTFDSAGVFAAAKNYGAGTQPSSVAVGDFNRDGLPDLATANDFGDSISVLLGNGNGTFATPAPTYAGGTHPYSITTGDFNGDGKLDLATANYYSNNVSILLGIGDGTFPVTPSYTYAAGTSPISIAVGDFNGDGEPDLVTANYGSDDVSLLLGNGDGTFQAAVNYTTGTGPQSVTVGDFNRDGKPDLATASWDNNNVSVLLGNGTDSNTFQAKVDYGAGTSPTFVTCGDFNRDGKLDLATANYYSNNVSILLGIGDGTFQTAVNYGVSSRPSSLVVSDFNGDGKPDLAVTNSAGSNVSILIGDGNGAFAAAVNYGVGRWPYSVAVGNFNRDGKPDLAMANVDSNNVSILLNTNFVFPDPSLAINNLQINGGLTLTASPTVTLTYTTSGSPSPTHIRTSTGIADPVTGAFWSTWKALPVGPPHTVNLGATNGTREVYAQLKEGDYMSPVARATIMLDTAAPAGRVKINGGAATVRNTGGLTTVHLHLTMFDRTMSGAQMRIKVGGGGFAGDPDSAAPWGAFATSTTKDLTGTGLKTIYVQFKDGVGKKSPVYAPQITVANNGALWLGVSTVTVSSLWLNDDDIYSTSPAMTFEYDIDNINVQARYCFINSSGTLAWTAWETPSYTGSGPYYNCTRNLTLTSGNIPRQVYVQLKETATGPNPGAMTNPQSDQIMLDTAAPSGALWIKNGAASVTRTGSTTLVSLTLVSNDTASGINLMAIYQGTAPATPDDGDFVGFSPTVIYPLDTTTTGTKKVHVWFKDKAGKISARKSDSINVLGP